MLSYEERKAIENLKIEYEKLMKEDNILFHLYKSDAKRLIDIIEKQSKEIEELKEDKYGLEEEVQMQAKNIMLCESALCEIQDKIKAKIEEVDREIEFEQNERVIIYLHKQKRVLQSLLEKE